MPDENRSMEMPPKITEGAFGELKKSKPLLKIFSAHSVYHLETWYPVDVVNEGTTMFRMRYIYDLDLERAASWNAADEIVVVSNKNILQELDVFIKRPISCFNNGIFLRKMDRLATYSPLYYLLIMMAGHNPMPIIPKEKKDSRKARMNQYFRDLFYAVLVRK